MTHHDAQAARLEPQSTGPPAWLGWFPETGSSP